MQGAAGSAEGTAPVAVLDRHRAIGDDLYMSANTAARRFTLAHVSDLHLGPLPATRPRELLNKRFLGYLSWKTRRQAVHDGSVLAALAADLRATDPDHVAITGDLVNLSLPGEFSNAAMWLQALGPPDRITVVPGNHDAYVRVPWQASLQWWTPYMASDPADGLVTAAADSAPFPFVRVRGSVALVGLSSARPSPPFRATGALGQSQIATLETVLAELGERGLFRLVLVHHPPLHSHVTGRKRLLDGEALQGAVRRAGAELVLHGHVHRPCLGRIATHAGGVPVVGVPSASARPRRSGHPAQYDLYAITRRETTWHATVLTRRYDETRGIFAPLSERPFALRG